MHQTCIERDGQRYRLAQAAKILRLFKVSQGRDASTVEELEQWITRPKREGPIKPDPEDFEAVAIAERET